MLISHSFCVCRYARCTHSVSIGKCRPTFTILFYLHTACCNGLIVGTLQYLLCIMLILWQSGIDCTWKLRPPRQEMKAMLPPLLKSLPVWWLGVFLLSRTMWSVACSTAKFEASVLSRDGTTPVQGSWTNMADYYVAVAASLFTELGVIWVLLDWHCWTCAPTFSASYWHNFCDLRSHREWSISKDGSGYPIVFFVS